MRIILPNRLCEVDPSYGPLFFLAGPVRGGDDWQAKGCEEIRIRLPQFYAAVPCRYWSDHPLVSHQSAGSDNHFVKQLSWERHYLEAAASKGCVIFWLPCESKTSPRAGDGPYAQDTRGELGEWRGRLMHDRNLQVVVGAEERFPGLSQIQRNFSEALGHPFPIHNSLPETIAAAIAKTRV